MSLLCNSPRLHWSASLLASFCRAVILKLWYAGSLQDFFFLGHNYLKYTYIKNSLPQGH